MSGIKTHVLAVEAATALNQNPASPVMSETARR
jgi:hypothetical protein